MNENKRKKEKVKRKKKKEESESKTTNNRGMSYRDVKDHHRRHLAMVGHWL